MGADKELFPVWLLTTGIGSGDGEIPWHVLLQCEKCDLYRCGISRYAVQMC